MAGWSDAAVWGIIAALGLGTWLVRFSFLGLIGGRRLPVWVMRHLRYTPVTVIPAVVAPLVLWPAATEGTTDPVRLTAALATVAAGFVLRSFLAGAVAGMLVLIVGLALF